MSDYFLGEIRLLSFAYAPVDWAVCDGSQQQVSQNNALFALIGATYGGNGSTTFNLPDMRGRVAVGSGTGPGLSAYSAGQSGGAYQVTLDGTTTPTHTHSVTASNAQGTSLSAQNAVFASVPLANSDLYVAQAKLNGSTATVKAYDASFVGTEGGTSPHNNIMPSFGVTYAICVQGLYPVSN